LRLLHVAIDQCGPAPAAFMQANMPNIQFLQSRLEISSDTLR
jgi:hypothetical protein